MIRRLVAAPFVALVLLGACGSDAPPPVAAKVDPALAPAEVLLGGVRLFENTEDGTRRVFADAGDTSLMADGRLWELRRVERLIGTLQISTLQPRVDLTDDRGREAIVRDILVGDSTGIRVGETEVFTITAGDRAVYVWFGAEHVVVLTVKGIDDIEPDAVLEDVVAHQLSVATWEPLSVDDVDDDEAEQ